MHYSEPSFFIVTKERSWPFSTDNPNPDQFRMYGRMLTDITYTPQDITASSGTEEASSFFQFTVSGRTAEIFGPLLPLNTVVMCYRFSGQWFVIAPCFVAIVFQYLDGFGVDLSNGGVYTYQSNGIEQVVPEVLEFLPYTIEVITTGSNKAEFDGLYTLAPRFLGEFKRMKKLAGHCVGPDLKPRGGLNMELEYSHEWDAVDEVIRIIRTITITHDDITETVYSGNSEVLSKVSGDSSLPDDICYMKKLVSNSPLWFSLDTGASDPIDGLYTLWPDYWEDVTDANYAESKGYIHDQNGNRQPMTYSMGYDAGTSRFTITVTTPSDSFSYICELADFSFVNNDTMYFTLNSDLSNQPGLLPQSLPVRRPSNGYNRTVRKSDQI